MRPPFAFGIDLVRILPMLAGGDYLVGSGDGVPRIRKPADSVA